MGGFSSISGSETIMFADNASFDGTKRGGALTTNGQLFIGSTASPHVQKGSVVAADSSITVGYSSPNITLKANTPVLPLMTAHISVETAGITGDGTDAVVIYDTATVNSGSMYDTTTGVLTIPQTGYYLLCASASLNNMLLANTVGFLAFEGSGYTNRFSRGNFGAMADYFDTGRLAINGSWLTGFAGGDTLTVNLFVGGNATKNVTVSGNDSIDLWSNFSVFLVATTPAA